MKIIRKGPASDWWIGLKRVCEHCHSTLQFELGDQVKIFETLPANPRLYFNCPVCSKEQSFYYSDVYQ